ncbi:hypothetical protein N0V95_006588 [Ascochyta clinopodiicola]|nr:hypothetical protein N0V95_006588 [Ascochyta clinopodiicola]
MVTGPTTPSESSFSISKLISQLRRRISKNDSERALRKRILKDTVSPLVPCPLPLVLPEHEGALSNLGWTTITFPRPPSASDTAHHLQVPKFHPLEQACEALFAASQAFFDLPSEEKKRWKHKLGSEEGWSSIPGEKEFITLRTLEYCPEILRGPAKRYWDLVGAHLETTLGRLATSLNIQNPDDPAKGLKKFVGPCATMQEEDQQKTATMLRLFRYEGWEAKEVAEPHADLGLLSVVVGNVPGLEVWDGAQWFEVEKEVEKTGSRGASLLAGRQLERLTNGRYPAGGHRVVSYADPDGQKVGGKRYRFSIVFVLRAHEPTIINSSELETSVTGKWLVPVEGLKAEDLYSKIRSAHYNININITEREKQRRQVRR